MEEILEKIKQLLTFTNADGAVKTYFNGTITQTQLIVIIITILVAIILLKKLKRMGKFIVLVATILSTYFNINILSPTKIVDMASKLNTPENKAKVESLVSNSSNIDMKDDKLSIKVGDEWIDLSEIKSVVKLEDGSISINVKGKDLVLTDKQVIKLLELLVHS